MYYRRAIPKLASKSIYIFSDNRSAGRSINRRILSLAVAISICLVYLSPKACRGMQDHSVELARTPAPLSGLVKRATV